MSNLDKQLLSAHATDDRPALIALYTQAADCANSVDATAFYLTHAYIFALETNSPKAPTLKSRLIKMKRDT